MSFNYRLIRYAENAIGIHKVYYDETGKINGHSAPIIVGNDLEDLKGEFAHIKQAFDKPVLTSERKEYKLIEAWAPVVYINLHTGKFHYFTGTTLSKDAFDLPEDAFEGLKKHIESPKN